MPQHMVSPHRRGPVYPPVYYDPSTYPGPASHGHYMGAYYPPPPGYYDPGMGGGPKYHGSMPRSHYPEYSNEDYRYGPYMHPY